jgi:hypothetical protein
MAAALHLVHTLLYVIMYDQAHAQQIVHTLLKCMAAAQHIVHTLLM